MLQTKSSQMPESEICLHSRESELLGRTLNSHKDYLLCHQCSQWLSTSRSNCVLELGANLFEETSTDTPSNLSVIQSVWRGPPDSSKRIRTHPWVVCSGVGGIWGRALLPRLILPSGQSSPSRSGGLRKSNEVFQYHCAQESIFWFQYLWRGETPGLWLCLCC